MAGTWQWRAKRTTILVATAAWGAAKVLLPTTRVRLARRRGGLGTQEAAVAARRQPQVWRRSGGEAGHGLGRTACKEACGRPHRGDGLAGRWATAVARMHRYGGGASKRRWGGAQSGRSRNREGEVEEQEREA